MVTIRDLARSVACIGLLLAGACAGRSAPTTVPLASCAPVADSRWLVRPGQAVRDVRVWIDQDAQEFDGWSTYGWRRLRTAMSAWNALRLPVRFVAANDARAAEVIVSVIATVPLTGDGRDGDQAGITNVAVAGGAILRAHVFVAVSGPYGARFSLRTQEANLLHELGHALGLPHATVNSAVMSVRRAGSRLTGADMTLARAHYGECASRTTPGA